MVKIQLEVLGYCQYLNRTKTEITQTGFEIGRVIQVHRERYIVKTATGEFETEITGNLRYTANDKSDFPVVGDWVNLSVFDSDFALIHNVFPRYSLIRRMSPGNFGSLQIIAANIDFAFLVQAADRDFNINRLERYLTICNDSGIKPVIILTKTDLFEESWINRIKAQIEVRIPEIPVFTVSNETLNGFSALKQFIEKGKTYCMLGSSGVGKSTLTNNLAGKNIMKTGNISQSTNKGKHITSHRELFILETGGILIDNPGMREVGTAGAGEGLEITFDKILSVGKKCKYPDCTHTREAGCMVLNAVEEGEIARDSYENYLKLERERAHFEASEFEKRKRDKMFGKMMKNYQKIRKNNSL